ncbi:16547_t:CDS:2, partial [Racocetra persica]
DTEHIPYEIYFKYYPTEKWARLHYVKEMVENYKNADNEKAHRKFFSTLKSIKDDESCVSAIRDRAQELLDDKDADAAKINALWDKYYKNTESSSSSTSPLPSLPSSVQPQPPPTSPLPSLPLS